MNLSHPILDEAQRIVDAIHQKQAQLEEEKLRLQSRIREIEAQTNRNKSAADRLPTFTVHSDGVHKCPRCWIVEEVSADLTPIGNDNGDDIFRCANCRDEFIVPA